MLKFTSPVTVPAILNLHRFCWSTRFNTHFFTESEQGPYIHRSPSINALHLSIESYARLGSWLSLVQCIVTDDGLLINRSIRIVPFMLVAKGVAKRASAAQT